MRTKLNNFTHTGTQIIPPPHSPPDPHPHKPHRPPLSTKTTNNTTNNSSQREKSAYSVCYVRTATGKVLLVLTQVMKQERRGGAGWGWGGVSKAEWE